MKASLRLLTAALLPAVSICHTHHPSVGNLTLIRCPDGRLEGNCIEDESSIVYPTKKNEPPGYFNSDYEFFVEWEAQHLLKWDKVDDEPMNLTVRFGRYTLEKEIREQRSLNFTFRDLGFEMLPHSNYSAAERTILGSATQIPDYNGFYFNVQDDFFANYTAAIKDFYILPFGLYHYMENTIYSQRDMVKDDLNKKWRIGVGVGVGVGVPLLMIATYILGKRKGKKSHLVAKQAS